MDLRVWIVFVVIVSRAVSKTSFKGCMEENTYGYSYFQYHSAERLSKSAPGSKNTKTWKDHYIEFYVKAQSNAHIFLSANARVGYEIVLGGGNNSFSQIRCVNGTSKKSVKTELTEGIVSKLEDRGFWIRLDHFGYVEVGKKNESKPFLKWLDPSPTAVDIVSFSTWTNVMGVWHFACRNGSQTDSSTDPGDGSKANWHGTLRNSLLTYYNPNVYPHRDGEPAETVELSLEMKNFDLDKKRGELKLSGITYLKWKDWKLKWNETDYENKDFMYASPHEIWTPYICVLNSIKFQTKSFLARKSGIVVKNDGVINWRTPFHSVIYCELGYKNWPFDTHNCSLTFGLLTEPINIRIIKMVASNISSSEWEIQQVNHSSVLDRTSVIQIFFRRRDESVIRILIFPSFFCSAVLSFISFWINPKSLMKLFLNCGSIVLLAAALLSLADDLPIMISPMPQIVHLYCLSIVVMCVPVLLFVGLRYIPHDVNLPGFLSELTKFSIVEMLCCCPEKTENNAVFLTLLIERLVFVIYFTTLVTPFMINFMVFEELQSFNVVSLDVNEKRLTVSQWCAINIFGNRGARHFIKRIRCYLKGQRTKVTFHEFTFQSEIT